jgi:hypothetical protein
MRSKIVLSLVAAGLFALASAPAGAASTKGTGVGNAPPHVSESGQMHRSKVASTKGANRRGFCPPGQRKKPGKGSAFNC